MLFSPDVSCIAPYSPIPLPPSIFSTHSVVFESLGVTRHSTCDNLPSSRRNLWIEHTLAILDYGYCFPRRYICGEEAMLRIWEKKNCKKIQSACPSEGIREGGGLSFVRAAFGNAIAP